jgi:hypothetical protein
MRKIASLRDQQQIRGRFQGLVPEGFLRNNGKFLVVAVSDSGYVNLASE